MIKKRVFHILIIGLCMLSVHVVAQPNEFIVKKRIYNQLDGLPNKKIQCGLEDQLGFLWFGTESGLCRFDGKQFMVFNLQRNGLLGNNVIQLALKDNDEIIITYGEPGSMRYTLPARQVINIYSFRVSELGKSFASAPFSTGNIISVSNTPNDQLVFITHDPQEVWTYDHDKGFRQRFKSNARLKNYEVRKNQRLTVFSNRERLIIQQGSGLICLYENSDSVWVFDNTHSIALNAKNTDYVSFKDAGKTFISHHIRISNNQKQVGAKMPGSYTDISENRNQLYFPSEKEQGTMVRRNDGSIYYYKPNEGVAEIYGSDDNSFSKNLQLNSWFRDSRNIFWLCSSEGLIRVKMTRNKFIQHYSSSRKDILKNNSARCIYANEDTLIVCMYDYLGYKTKEKDLLIEEGRNFGLLTESKGAWIGAFELKNLDLATAKVKKINTTRGYEIWGIHQLNSNELLLFCTVGIERYTISTDQTDSIDYLSFPPAKVCYRVFRSAAGELVVVAANGLYLLNNAGEVTDYYGSESSSADHRFPFSTLHDAHEDKDGIFWIATGSEGLYRWDRKQHSFRQFEMESGFLSNTIYGIQEDEKQQLWLSSDFGLSRFNKKTHQVKTYLAEDGIASNEFNRTSHFKSKDGRMYFGGINGVTSFLPQDFSEDTISQNYPFHITGITWFNEKNGKLESPLPASDTRYKLNIEPGIKFFSIAFSLLDFDERVHRYAYKIEGIEKEWNFTSESSLRYGSLPYGNYMLRIRAQTSSGHWNNEEINIPLSIEIPFYKTWWFVLMLAVIFVLVVTLIAMQILRQRVKNMKRLDNLRLKLASDLHDEVGGLLNKTAIQSDMVRMKAGAAGENREILEKISENCRKAMSGMRDIMWNLDSRNDSTESLLDRIKEYCHDMLGDQYNYSIHSNTFSIDIDPDVRQALYLIFKEAINNIVKHVPGGNVEILFITTEKESRLRVFNETAFKEKKVFTGQGLENMKMRAEKVGGTFLLKTENGVTVEVTIPLKSHKNVTQI